ncbi:pentapeptide repeat-containing protein [Candidatus Microthrix parvicella]|uniref:pentapeptide repeat-containing protein n=1 Tax=Candidatus Neomicrothrix parvicella TaxID=41950 RepID=UPI0004CE5AC8|nr:pentapeptide repeat-containing protein [Candidatus Microthrix parvicella]
MKPVGVHFRVVVGIAIPMLFVVGCSSSEDEGASEVSGAADVEASQAQGEDAPKPDLRVPIAERMKCPDGLRVLARDDVVGVDVNENPTYLECADISGMDLSGLNLIGSTRGVYMLSTDMSDANLSEARMSGANMHGANLSGADLTGTDLAEAFLDNVDFTGTDLSTTSLSGVEWTPGNDPIWPVGFDAPVNSYDR